MTSKTVLSISSIQGHIASFLGEKDQPHIGRISSEWRGVPFRVRDEIGRQFLTNYPGWAKTCLSVCIQKAVLLEQSLMAFLQPKSFQWGEMVNGRFEPLDEWTGPMLVVSCDANVIPFAWAWNYDFLFPQDIPAILLGRFLNRLFFVEWATRPNEISVDHALSIFGRYLLETQHKTQKPFQPTLHILVKDWFEKSYVMKLGESLYPVAYRSQGATAFTLAVPLFQERNLEG
jgi:hypothetical protein